MTAYVLTFGGLLLTGARLGDAYGKLRVFAIGIAVFSGASLLGGLALGPRWLIAARAVQGLGAALAAPGALALLVTNSRNETSRRTALALFSAVGVAGGAAGLLLGGILTETASWRWTLLLNVPLGIVVLVFARRFLTETGRSPGRFDYSGAIATIALATSVVLTLSGLPDRGWRSPATIVGLTVATVMLVALVFVERRVTAPLIRPELLKSRRRVGALITGSFVLGGQSSLMFIAVQYLQNGFAYSPIAAGAAFLPMTIGIFGMSRVIPRIVARIGPAVPIVVGTAGLASSYFLFVLITGTADILTILLIMLLNGVSAGLCFMPITSIVLQGVAPEITGSASGLLQTTQNLGSAIAIALVTAVYAAGAVPGEFLPGVAGAFAAVTCLAVAALLSAVILITPTARQR